MQDEDCSACTTSHTRREFIQDALGLAIGALAALGASHNAAGMTFRFADGVSAREGVTYPIPSADGVTIDKSNQVILVRWEGLVYAFGLSCPHQNTALRWKQDAGRFQCPKHKSKYRPDGKFESGRATRGMDRYAIRREADSVVVDVAALLKETDDEAAWTAACVSVT
jgi:nitrite reductase/ring-hydroxylating ferredoxin subunit